MSSVTYPPIVTEAINNIEEKNKKNAVQYLEGLIKELESKKREVTNLEKNLSEFDYEKFKENIISSDRYR